MPTVAVTVAATSWVCWLRSGCGRHVSAVLLVQLEVKQLRDVSSMTDGVAS